MSGAWLSSLLSERSACVWASYAMAVLLIGGELWQLQRQLRRSRQGRPPLR